MKTSAFLKPRRGQTLVEYALIIAFVSVVAIAVLATTGRSISGTFYSVNTQLATAQNGGVGGSTPGGRGN